MYRGSHLAPFYIRYASYHQPPSCAIDWGSLHQYPFIVVIHFADPCSSTFERAPAIAFSPMMHS